MSEVPDGFREVPVGPLPETWDVVSLGDVVSQRSERAGDRDLEVMSCSKIHGVILQSEKFKRRVASKNTARYKVIRPGAFVYDSMLLWDGSIGRNNYDFAGVVSPAYYVFEASPEVSGAFLELLLRARPIMIPQYNRISEGTNRRRRKATFDDFVRIPVPFPPLPEQRAIAHVLRTVQRAREATDGVIAAVRELKRSLMRHLFTYGPVPVGEAERVELQDTEIGAIPVDWEVVALGQAIKGTQYGTSIRAESTGKYPMLRMNNLVNGRVDTRDLKYIDLDDDELAKFKVNRGDVLFNRTNSFELVGKTSIFDLEGDYVFASYLVRVIGDGRKLHPSYLNYFLNWQSAQDRLKQLATRGVSQSNISATKLRGFNIGLPSLPEQREIARILSVADAKIAAEEARREALDGLFHSLLHHLMTGRIRTQGFQRQDARTPSREEKNLGDFAT